MADKANKYADNAAGGFYVDTQCIDCDLCRQTAPSNFDRNQSGGYSFVKKQPTTPEEEALCKKQKRVVPLKRSVPTAHNFWQIQAIVGAR